MWLKISGSLKVMFWIIIAGSIKEALLLINISFAANFPRIFVECIAIAMHSTKILGKLAAKEIFIRSKASFMEPAIMIQNMTFNDPEIFNHINIYFSNRNLNNNFVSILP